MGNIPDPYAKVTWRGVRLDRIDKVAFEVLEDKLSATATIYQGGYNPGGVTASAGAHDGGGAIDFWFPGIDPRTVERVARRIGWDAWYRYPPTFPTHIHAIRHNSPTAAPVAKGQMTDYENLGDGLIPLGYPDDDNRYRPDPIPTFGVAEYRAELKRRKLRDQLRRIGRNIKHLTRRKRAIRRQLDKLS